MGKTYINTENIDENQGSANFVSGVAGGVGGIEWARAERTKSYS